MKLSLGRRRLLKTMRRPARKKPGYEVGLFVVSTGVWEQVPERYTKGRRRRIGTLLS